MTRKKHTVSRLFLALIALTLVSFCFLGSTFARYTSTGTGTAITQVAKWSITESWNGTEVEGETQVAFGKLSPSQAEWTSTDAPRTHKTGKILVAQITNGGEVNALVTLTADEVVTFKEDTTMTLDPAVEGLDTDDAKSCFSIQFYWTKDSATEATQTTITGIELNVGEILYVYAEVTWTSLDNWGAITADMVDTWIGENITEVSWGLTYTAVQNSQKP